ncbi:MAG: NAD-dependent protein deacylase [Spirochaetaceae bacterium]|jgi:NAD-dependent deacetylase|nr:NAD-dependent protein deacylase [Spirochaetaceae bacterium]
MDSGYGQLERLIGESGRIVFFGGAGVSTESGIPDFRSTGGLYHQEWAYSPETILSHTFFMAQTAEFYRFYRAKMIVDGAKPNAAHIALTRLEKRGKISAVVTQNIDGLHQMAGSKKVFELHGSIRRNYCMKCGEFYPLSVIAESGSVPDGIPRCAKPGCGGIIKPDVVLYEEGLDSGVMDGAIAAIAGADMLIIGGTSLTVYPAAGLVNYFHGPALVVINRDVVDGGRNAAVVIQDSIGKVFAALELDK